MDDCSLGNDDLTARVAEWRAVADRGLVGSDRLPNALQLRFSRVSGVGDELARLVEAETRCCGWAGWRLVETADTLDVYATGPDDSLDALAQAFSR